MVFCLEGKERKFFRFSKILPASKNHYLCELRKELVVTKIAYAYEFLFVLAATLIKQLSDT
jgi:hypothetical protein